MQASHMWSHEVQHGSHKKEPKHAFPERKLECYRHHITMDDRVTLAPPRSLVPRPKRQEKHLHTPPRMSTNKRLNINEHPHTNTTNTTTHPPDEYSECVR